MSGFRSVLSRKAVWHSTRSHATPPGVEAVPVKRPGPQIKSLSTREKENLRETAKHIQRAAAAVQGRCAGPDDDSWVDEDVEPLFFGHDPSAPASSRLDHDAHVQLSEASFSGFLPPSVPFKTRQDTRTRAEQIKAEQAAWDEHLPSLVDSFLAWRDRDAASQPSSPTLDSTAASADDDPNWFTINAVEESGFTRDLHVPYKTAEQPVIALMRKGLVACTPKQPVAAIAVEILEFYYRLRRHAPRLGVQPFVRALCDKLGCPYRPHLREQFAQALDVYLSVLRELERRVATALGRGGPHWRAKNACPCCTYQLNDEEVLGIEGMVAMDGGQSLKRSAAAGRADGRVFDSSYAVPSTHIDLYENEVGRRVKPSRKAAKESDEQQWQTLPEPGEPGDDAPTPSVCSQRWKNAKAEHFKTAPGLFEQTGIFPCLCRHGLVLWYTEMIRSGELAKYGLGMVSQMLSAGMRNRYVGYDIGCAFQGTLSRSSLGSRAGLANISFGLNSFHGYGHNRLCQLKNHPIYRKGFGLEDLETCERFFSASNAVAPLVRHASHFHYVQFLDMFLGQWDADKYAELSRFIGNNVAQAFRIIAEHAVPILEFQKRTGYTDEQIEGWRTDELQYLENLKSEPERDVLEIDYVQHLIELQALELNFQECLEAFLEGLPPPTVSAREIAAKKLSAADVRKLNKARGDAYRKYTAGLDAVAALESALGIDERWEPGSSEFIAAERKMVERNWRRALDRLELLMVQRMFELAKAHAFGTGYKLREAIGKGIKARSSAIRTAVAKYNAAAAALTPPAPVVEFATLMEWTQLQEFDLLRNSRDGELGDRPWAQPANRVMAVKFHKLARAREELARCRVEMRRLVTAMQDEEALFRRTIDEVTVTNPALAREVARVAQLRIAVNDHHRHRLGKLVRRYPVFAESFTCGTRVGQQSQSAAATAPTQQARSEPQAGEEEDVDDDEEIDEQEYEAIEDFISHLE